MKVFRYIVKTAGWLVAGLVALLVVLLAAVHTPWGKRQIVSIAVTGAGKVLDAELTVGRLTGCFFSHIALEDIALRSAGGDTIASVARVALAYNLDFLLWQHTVWVDSVVIDRPSVNLRQLPDSSWNVARLLRPADTADETDGDTATSTLPALDVVLRHFSLHNARVCVDALDTLIPRRVDSLSFVLQGGYEDRKLWGSLDRLHFTASQPDLRLRPSSLWVEATPEGVKNFRVELQTARNGLRLSAHADFSRKNLSGLLLITDSLHFDEFRPWLPPAFPRHAHPKLIVEVAQQQDSLDGWLLVGEGRQQVYIGAKALGVVARLNDSTAPPVTYRVDLYPLGVDPGFWLHRPDMSHPVSGGLHLRGAGFDPHSLDARLWGQVDSIRLPGQWIERLALDLDYKAGDLTGHIKGQGDFGALRLSPRLQQLLDTLPRYHVGLRTDSLDASAFLGDTTYRTDINLNADLTGSGFDLDRLDARARLQLAPSSALGVGVDTLRADLAFARGRLTIDRLLLEALDARLEAGGQYSLTGNSELWLEARVDSLDRLNRLAGTEGLETQVCLSARAHGRPDSLDADLQAAAVHTRYGTVRADSLLLDARAALRGKDLTADARLDLRRPAVDALVLDSVALQLATDTRNHRLAFRADGRDMNARLHALVQTGDAIRVTLSDLAFAYRDYAWRQLTDTAFARISDTDYEVRGLHLATTGDTLPSSLYVDGLLSRTDSQQVAVRAERVDIGRLLDLADVQLPVDGLADLNLCVTGAAASPCVQGRLAVDSMAYGDLRFDTLQSDLLLLGRRLEAGLTVVPRGLGRVSLTAALPARVRPDSMDFQVVPAADDSIRAALRADRVPLALVRPFLDAGTVEGMLNCHIDLAGTWAAPRAEGRLRLDSGAVKMPPYGIDYRNMQADIRLTEDRILLDTFLIQSPDGTMTARGGVQFRSELYRADLDSSRLDIAFNRFNPFSHKQFKMEMSGGVGVRANADSTSFGGRIEIPEANVYLPAVMALMGGMAAPDVPQPLLMAELEKLTQPGDSLVYTFRPDTTKTDTAATHGRPAFLDNLQGEVAVHIPRNTWIRNEDMRLELSGDVRLVKHRDFFELFGTIDVVRGQYNMLGKVFVIQNGTVTFQGGERINPILNIEALYSFRDPYRNKRDLSIAVSGDLEHLDELTIKFKLEGEEIGEGDALSYIIFGRALSELSASESSGVDPGKLAGMAAASLVSSQLTKLGNTFNVDYIEVDVGSSFDNASLTVGKYITNKLFISYEQRIGALEDTDTARYEMTLEYELFKFLFLQLTSSPITNGFDVIFKMESKQ